MSINLQNYININFLRRQHTIYGVFFCNLICKYAFSTILLIDAHHKLFEAEWRAHSSVNFVTQDNGLVPVRRQSIIWTNAGSLIIVPSEKNGVILTKIKQFSYKKWVSKYFVKNGRNVDSALMLKLLAPQ